MHRFAAALAALAALAGCHTHAPGVDPKAVTSALDRRFAAITDFSLEGTAEQGSEKLPYAYAMKQPTFVRAAIGPMTITFDGKALLVLDGDKKTAQRQDLGAYPEAQRLLVLHQAFSRFVCEGWRPPLLRPSGFSVAADGADRWVVTVPIEDARLKEQRLVLKAPGAELVEKTIVDKAGKVVARTSVVEELKDEKTGLVFPKDWKSDDVHIHVDKAVVNGGLAAELFKTDVPAGYSSP